jgi:hypothetical protein
VLAGRGGQRADAENSATEQNDEGGPSGKGHAQTLLLQGQQDEPRLEIDAN